MKFLTYFKNNLFEGLFELKDKEWDKLNNFLNKIDTGYYDLFWIYIIGYFASYMNSPKQAKVKQFLQDELNNDNSEFWKIFNYIQNDNICPSTVLKKINKIIKRIQRKQSLDNINYIKNYIKDCIAKIKISPKIKQALLNYQNDKIDIIQLLQEFFIYLQKNSLRFLPIYKLFKYVILKDTNIQDDSTDKSIQNTKNIFLTNYFSTQAMCLDLFLTNPKSKWDDIVINPQFIQFFSKNTKNLSKTWENFNDFVNQIPLEYLTFSISVNKTFIKEVSNKIEKNPQYFIDYFNAITKAHQDDIFEIESFYSQLFSYMIENKKLNLLYQLSQNIDFNINNFLTLRNISLIDILLKNNANIFVNMSNKGNDKIDIILHNLSKTYTVDYNYKLIFELIKNSPCVFNKISNDNLKNKDKNILSIILYNFYEIYGDNCIKDIIENIFDNDINVLSTKIFKKDIKNDFKNYILKKIDNSIDPSKKIKLPKYEDVNLTNKKIIENESIFVLTCHEELTKVIEQSTELLQAIHLLNDYGFFKKFNDYSIIYQWAWYYLTNNYTGIITIPYNEFLIISKTISSKIEKLFNYILSKALSTSIDEKFLTNENELYFLGKSFKYIFKDVYNFNTISLLQKPYDDKNMLKSFAILYLIFFKNAYDLDDMNETFINRFIKIYLFDYLFRFFPDDSKKFFKSSLKNYPNLTENIKKLLKFKNNNENIILSFYFYNRNDQSNVIVWNNLLINILSLSNTEAENNVLNENYIDVFYNKKSYENIKNYKKYIQTLKHLKFFKNDIINLLLLSKSEIEKLYKEGKIEVKIKNTNIDYEYLMKKKLNKIKIIDKTEIKNFIDNFNKLSFMEKDIALKLYNFYCKQLLSNKTKSIKKTISYLLEQSYSLYDIINNLYIQLELFKPIKDIYNNYQELTETFLNLSMIIFKDNIPNTNENVTFFTKKDIYAISQIIIISNFVNKFKKILPNIKNVITNTQLNQYTEMITKNIEKSKTYEMKEYYIRNLLSSVADKKNKAKLIQASSKLIDYIFKNKKRMFYKIYLKKLGIVNDSFDNKKINSKNEVVIYFLNNIIEKNYGLPEYIKNNTKDFLKFFELFKTSFKNSFLDYLSQNYKFEENKDFYKLLLDKKIITLSNLENIVTTDLSNEKIMNEMKKVLFKESILPIVSKINDNKFKETLKINNISVNKVSLKRYIKNKNLIIPKIKKDLSNINDIANFYNNLSKDYVKTVFKNSDIKSVKYEIDELDQIAWNLAKYLQKPGIHGNTMCKILQVFDINLDNSAFEEFKKDYGDTVYPMFHGTGSIAANFILRFGFAITDGKLIKAGRALGNGIYFTNVLDKTLGYVGDSNWGRQWGTKGYLLELEVALGKENKHYSFTNIFKSPEWCAFYPGNQIKIKRAYFIEIVKRSLYIPYLENKFGKIKYLYF